MKPEESQRAGVSPWGGGFEACVCLAGRGGEQDLCRPWGGVSRAEWKCPSSSLHSHLLQRRLIPVQLRGSGSLRLFSVILLVGGPLFWSMFTVPTAFQEFTQPGCVSPFLYPGHSRHSIHMCCVGCYILVLKSVCVWYVCVIWRAGYMKLLVMVRSSKMLSIFRVAIHIFSLSCVIRRKCK